MENAWNVAREILAIVWVRALLVLLASLIAARAANFLLCRALSQLTRRTSTELDDRLIAVLHRPIFLTVVLLGTQMAVRIPEPAPGVLYWTDGLIRTALVMLWLVAGIRVVHAVLDGMSRLAHRVAWLEARTLPLFDNLGKILMFGAAAYGILVAWDLDVTPWLASAGIAGIALGFAAKDTLANLFGGLFVVVDSPYTIGDYINLDSGERGKVVKIGLRSTRLLTRDDVEITVPNAVIAAAKIVNESGGHWVKTRVTVTVGVAYGSDVDQVRAVLLEAARGVTDVLPDPEPRVRFTELGDSALVFRVLCWIEEPEFRGRCIDGLNTAIYKALNQAGITIPFPQRDVHLRRAAPAR